MRARAELLAFRIVLWAIAWLLAVASRRHPRIRRQLTRDILFEISSADGASQHIRINAQARTITAPRRPFGPVECRLRFTTAREGITTLLAPDTAGRIVRGMNAGRVHVDGNPVLVLWLHGLTRVVVPIGRTHYPRRPVPAPPRGPETTAPWASRVIREPASSELDPGWTAAWRAREKLLQTRGPAGDPLPRG